MINGFDVIQKIVFDNLTYVLTLFFIILVIHFIIFRKNIYDIIDPIIISIILPFSASALVIILMKKNDMFIYNKFYYSFWLTQLSYCVGFLINKPIKLKKEISYNSNIFLSKSEILRDRSITKILFWITSGTYIFSQLMVYKQIGIPLFMEGSRLDFYTGNGVFKRFADIFMPISLFISIKYIYSNNEHRKIIKFFAFLVLLFGICSLLLSKSRSGILLYINLFFYYKLFLIKNSKKEQYNKLYKTSYVVIILAIFSTLILFFITSNGKNLESGIFSFLMRLVGFGDIYPMFYSSKVGDYISKGNWFIQMFGNVLSLFRIYPYEMQVPVIGIQIYQKLTETNLQFGPNLRFNIYGYLYFGFYGSIIYSFIIGFIAGFVRNKIYFKIKPTFISMLVYMTISIQVLTFSSDISLAMSNIIPTLLMVFIIYTYTYFPVKSIINKKFNKPLLKD